MLNVLHLFRPTYALTALILFGGWQGYAFVRSVPERLGLPPRAQQAQADEEHLPPPIEGNRLLAGLRQASGLGRAAVWGVGFSLLSLACVPIVRRVLSRESNAATAVMLAGFVGAGVGLAMLLAGFVFGTWQIVLFAAAAGYALAFVIWLAGEVEKMRLQDALSCS